MTKVKDSDLEKISGGMTEISLDPSGGPLVRPAASRDGSGPDPTGGTGAGGQLTDLQDISDSNVGD